MNNNLPVTNVLLKKSLKSELVKLLIWSIFSLIIGFLLIFIFLKPTGGSVNSLVVQTDADKDVDNLSLDAPISDSPILKVEDSNKVEDIKVSENSLNTKEKAMVPPGDLPSNLHQTQSPYILMCWDKSGLEHDSSQCDELADIQALFDERLYVVRKCIDEESSTDAYGKLSVAAEIDFEHLSISFWNGASSEISKADDVITCLRDKLSGFPLNKIDHDFSRYRIFFTLKAGIETEKLNNENTVEISDKPVEARGGKIVPVIKDKVRVRKSPVTGEIIGKISAPNSVSLLKQDGEWCNIITPNNNEGWIICTALEIK
ncbi:MAG: SH3 domain-containing protein [Deltaproteobacteria bacterium]|nr:SH3 domain-containing protein [Deltaproteobacteria bacterium]